METEIRWEQNGDNNKNKIEIGTRNNGKIRNGDSAIYVQGLEIPRKSCGKFSKIP